MSAPSPRLLHLKSPELALRSAAIYLAGRWRHDLAGLSPDERRALCLPLLVLLLAFTIGWFIRGSGLVLEEGFHYFLLFALPVYALARALYRWAVEDESLWRVLVRDVRPDLPLAALGTDAKRIAWPILTVSLIAANAWVFVCVDDPWTYAFASDEPGNWPWTAWISLFLHTDTDHLLGNMAFLWAFGSALEGRIPRLRLLGLYLAAGLAANAVNLLGVFGLEDPIVWSIGASGAIAGLMGLLLVRCRTTRISLAATPLGLPLPFAPRVRVHASFLVGLYFAMDLASARAISEGAPSTIGHWAHVGGCLFGVAAGYASGLYRGAARESIETQALASGEHGDYGRAASARDSLLNSDPDHIGARLERARAQHRFSCSSEAASDYQHAMRLLIAKDRERAADVFIEYWRKYLRPLELRDQLRLTSALIARGQLDMAARCLEVAAREPGADPDLCATARARETEILTAMGISRPAPAAITPLDRAFGAERKRTDSPARSAGRVEQTADRLALLGELVVGARGLACLRDMEVDAPAPEVLESLGARL